LRKVKLEEFILGHIMCKPELIDMYDIKSSFFKSEKERLVLKEIKSGETDPGIIAKNLDEEFPYAFSYVSGLFDGVPKTCWKMVPEYMKRVKIERERMSITKMTDEGARKGIIDHDGIEEHKEKIKKLEEKQEEEQEAKSIEEIAEMVINPIEWMVYPILEKSGYTIAGGIKGIGKSLFVTQLAFYIASGTSPFLSEELTIEKPRKVLLVQQEVSFQGIQDRLRKMRMEKSFWMEGRFRQKTTTREQWDLMEPEDRAKLMNLINKYRPEVLIMDPLYTFHKKGLNADKDAAPILKITQELKTEFNIGVIWVHHFSNKGDPEAGIQTVGRFMGSSNIANAADVTIAMDFMHPRYKNQELPLPYNHYVEVEITTRHGEWPKKFTIERGEGCILFKKSNIWEEIGRKILPGQIEEIIRENGGEMKQIEIIRHLSREAGHTTVRKAIKEVVRKGIISREKSKEHGGPIILRIIN